MDQLSIRLLGTFQVSINGGENLVFATEKARALLAYLAVEHGHSHSRESLANLLWPDQSEERARQNLRQALLHLRQALGDADQFLEVTTQSVKILSNGSVSDDVNQLLEKVKTSRTHTHRSIRQCYPCLLCQQQIVDLYQGEFLEGFSISSSEPFEEWVLLTRETLHQAAMQSLTYLADLFEIRGDIEKSLIYARRLVQFEPWREEIHRQLMRLLVCDGQYSSALAQYKTCQRMIEKEFGLQPAAETTALFRAIIAGKTADCRPQTPVQVLLPHSASSFIGREIEQIEITERLANPACRLLTLLGPGGTGKTRLAMQIARQLHGLYPDGIFFLQLSSVRSLNEVILMLLDTFDIPIPAGANPTTLLNIFMKAKSCLLILDNFENLVEECAALSDLFYQAANVQILITSRQRLQLREEWVYYLEGLSVPPKDSLLENTQNYDALTLFENRAAQLDQRFRLTPDRMPAAAAICQLVGGSPLGIELSTVAAIERGCTVVAAELKASLDNAAFTFRNLPSRHQSLRAVFEQSWSLLSPSEQTRISVLSIFPGSFSLEAAAAVANVQAEQLSNLAAKSLLREENDQRYSFHAVLYEFSREKLEADPINAGIIQQKHAEYFALFAEQLTTLKQIPGDSTNLLMQERNNIVQAWRWCLTQKGTAGTATRLLPGLTIIYHHRGPLDEGITLLEESAETLLAMPDHSKELLLTTQLELVSLLGTKGDFSASLEVLNQIAPEMKINNDDGKRYLFLYTKGRILAMQGEAFEARPLLEEALSLAQEKSQPENEANCLRELGNIAMREGDSLVGRKHYLKALDYFQTNGNHQGECSLTNNIGLSFWDTGELDQATEWLERALHLYQSLGDLRGEAKALTNLSNVLADRGLLTESFSCLKSALEILDRIGNLSGKASALHNMGSLYLSLGQFGQAEECYQQALAIFIDGNNRQGQAETLGNLGLLAGLQGKSEYGITLLESARTLSQECGDKINEANTLLFQMRIEKEMGRFDQADIHVKQCADLRQIVPHLARQMETDIEEAHLRYLEGKSPEAMALLDPVLDILNAEGLPEGLEDPLRIYWLAYEILNTMKDLRAAEMIHQAQAQLKRLAGQIKDPILRISFLENFNTHRLVRSVKVQ